MFLSVVRHGETDYNAQGRYAGSADVPLNGHGIAQAGELAHKLSGRAFDAVVSSPLLRARRTAEIVCEALSLSFAVHNAFAERCVGVYEGLTREEAQAAYPETWARLASRAPDDGPEGGETIRAFDARIAQGLDDLRASYPGKRVLLVSHGFTARAIHRILRGLSFEEMHGFSLGNCEIAEYSL